MTTSTALAPVETVDDSFNTSTAALVLHEGALDRTIRLAEVMAGSARMVPKHLRNNVGDCMAVAMQAMQWRMNPYALAAKSHIVGETVGYESQAIVAAINTSGKLVGNLEYEWFGDWSRIVGRFKQVESREKRDEHGNPKKYIVADWDFNTDEEGLGVTVRGVLRSTGKTIELQLLMKQARTRNSTLWVEDPKQQLAYLASKRWGRLHTPEVILGVYSPDEFDSDMVPKDMGPADVVPKSTKPAALSEDILKQWEAASRKGRREATKFFGTLDKGMRALATVAQKQAMWAIAEKADAERTVDAPTGQPAEQGAPATSSPAAAPASNTQAGAEATLPTDDEFLRDFEQAEKAGAANA